MRKDLQHPHPAVASARLVARLMDEAFEIPVIKKRIGLDPILGVLPGAGDLLAFLISAYPVILGIYYGLPKSYMVKMLMNLGLDAVIGAIPFIGDFFDFAFKANVRNVRLLEKAYSEGHLINGGAQAKEAASRLFNVVSAFGAILFKPQGAAANRPPARRNDDWVIDVPAEPS